MKQTRLNALWSTTEPGHSVLDGDLLVLEVVEREDARVLAQVEQRPDVVAEVLGLEVDHYVVQLPVGRQHEFFGGQWRTRLRKGWLQHIRMGRS